MEGRCVGSESCVESLGFAGALNPTAQNPKPVIEPDLMVGLFCNSFGSCKGNFRALEGFFETISNTSLCNVHQNQFGVLGFGLGLGLDPRLTYLGPLRFNTAVIPPHALFRRRPARQMEKGP